jgi:hypothetical protein
MALKDDNDRYTLRSAIQKLLVDNIPEGGGLNSDSDKYYYITWKRTADIKGGWSSCNAFATWASNKIGAPGNFLKGLDLSLADTYPGRAGSWINANDPVNWDLRPQPGDFFSTPLPGQTFGHVGIVYDFDNYAQTWRVVQGGQKNGGDNRDWIKWNEPNSSFPWAEVNGWVDIVLYTYGQE